MAFKTSPSPLNAISYEQTEDYCTLLNHTESELWEEDMDSQ